MLAAPFTIKGWAQDVHHPHLPVLLEMLLGDEVVASFLACDYRSDLDEAGFGGGRAGFVLTSPRRLTAAMLASLRIRRASDHAELARSEKCRASVGDAAVVADVARPALRLVG